jgi:hypothetical protein
VHGNKNKSIFFLIIQYHYNIYPFYVLKNRHAPLPNYHTTRCPPSNSIYKIGRTMFETNRIPDGWEKRINMLDEVWVPTQFSKDIFISAGIIENKIKIIGEPVDTTFYSPQIKNNNEIILDIERNTNNNNLNNLLELENYIKVKNAFCFLFVGKW